MTRPLRKMPTPVGVGLNQTATIALPIGLTYHRFDIRARANLGAGVVDVPAASWSDLFSEIRLIVDADTKIQLSGADAVALAQYYGETLTDGVLPIFLDRPWMTTPDGQDQTAYGTAGGMSSFTMEMDIGGAPVTAVESIEVTATQSPGRPFGPHLRIQRFVHNQGVTGEAEISDLPRGPYAAFAIHTNTANVTDVEVLADQRKVHESDVALRANAAGIAGRVPQSGYTHIDFCHENRLVEALPMALQDFRVKPTFTGTGNFNMLVESIQGA